MAIVNDDGIHEDEFMAAVHTLPPELKRVYITARSDPEGSTEPADALKTNGVVYPTPDYLNPPEREPTVPVERPEAKVLYKTSSPLVNITDHDIEDATNIAMSAGPGTMVGVVSRTLDKGALAVAQAAEKEGLTSREIYDKTGFFKGADKRWRTEIDDSGMKWTPPKPGVSGPLHLFLDHPDLYAAYPGIENIHVHNAPYFPSKGGEWNGRTVTLGSEAANDKGILMHEIQHAIQDREDFARGGAPGKAGRDYELKYEADVNKLRPMFMKLQKLDSSGEALSRDDQTKLDYLKHVFKKYSEYSSAGDKQARENYLALSGETEARNVQTRVDLEPAERARISPLDSMDTPFKDQIVNEAPLTTNPYLKGGMEIRRHQIR